MNDTLDKLSDFFVNLAVVAIGIALFQGDMEKVLPGLASLGFAVILAILKGVNK